MNAIKNKSMLEDYKLNEIELFKKYQTTKGIGLDMNGFPRDLFDELGNVKIGHIMTKLVDEGVYKVDEIIKERCDFSLRGREVNKFSYDLYELFKDSELLSNYNGAIFFDFDDDARFRFIGGLNKLLISKFEKGEIDFDTWMKIRGEIKTLKNLEQIQKIKLNRESWEISRNAYLKINTLIGDIPENINNIQLIIDFISKYGFQDIGIDIEEFNINGKLDKENIYKILTKIYTLTDKSFEECFNLFSDFVNLKIEQTKFVNGLNNLKEMK